MSQKRSAGRMVTMGTRVTHKQHAETTLSSGFKKPLTIEDLYSLIYYCQDFLVFVTILIKEEGQHALIESIHRIYTEIDCVYNDFEDE